MLLSGVGVGRDDWQCRRLAKESAENSDIALDWSTDKWEVKMNRWIFSYLYENRGLSGLAHAQKHFPVGRHYKTQIPQVE